MPAPGRLHQSLKLLPLLKSRLLQREKEDGAAPPCHPLLDKARLVLRMVAAVTHEP